MSNSYAGGYAKNTHPKTQQNTRKKLHRVKEIAREEHAELIKARRRDLRKQAGPVVDKNGEVLFPGRRKIDRAFEGVQD